VPVRLADMPLAPSSFASPDTRYGVQSSVPPWVVKLRIAVAAVGAVVAPFVYPPTIPLVALFLVSFAIRMWVTEAIYHRYFSHRAFKARRFAQFVFALLGTQNGQRGPLWWAAKHRVHHQHADSPEDPHSPNANSFAYAFVAWLWDPQSGDTNLDMLPDFARFPELRWLNKNYASSFYGGAALLVLAGHYGWMGPGITGGSALLWGFFLPVTATLLGVGLVNVAAHRPDALGGFRRFATEDRSVNRPLLALVTLGGGWHNNHHRFAASARAGFAWWEIDLSYYVLRLLEFAGVVHEVKGKIPDAVLREGGLARRSRGAGDG
jgi:stearoyl-CoA desaturase (delta-9 desaturase)